MNANYYKQYNVLHINVVYDLCTHYIVTPTLNDIGLGLTYANQLPICGLLLTYFSITCL